MQRKASHIRHPRGVRITPHTAAAAPPPASIEPEPIDLHTLLGQFVALRHEVNLQTKSVRAQQGRTADQARLARLERAGVIRRGRPISQWLIDEPPVKLPKGVSVLEALLEERRSGR